MPRLESESCQVDSPHIFRGEGTARIFGVVLPLFLHVQAGPGVGVEKCTVSCHEWKADTNVKLDRKTDDASCPWLRFEMTHASTHLVALYVREEIT